MMVTRKLTLGALIIVSVFLSGCSFSTRLVVVNRSDKPVEVRYRFKDAPGSFSPPKPAIKAIAELDDNSPWNDLSATQFEVSSHSRTITVMVAPNTALYLDHVRGPGIPEDYEFPISEIVMRGQYGTIMLHGQQARKSFGKEEKGIYSVSYK